MNKVNPPKIASIIFNKFLSPYDGATATGDLEEEFYLIIEEEGIKEAKKWYKRQVYKSIPLFLQNLTNWSLPMFKNYLKSAIRTIIRQKGFSFINISGLAIGMACCLLMLLWSQDELNYDEFHENLDNIYRIVDGQQTDPRIERSALSVPPIAASMKNDYPEIIRSTRFDFDNRLVKYKDKIFNEFGYINADPEFFEMFNFPFISGDPKTAISSPNSVVLTREMAEKYFGEEEPMGKTMIIDNNIDVIVTGVVENVPKNSTLQFDFISLFAPPFYSPNQMRNWNAGMLYSFVQLAEGVSVGSLNEKVSDYLIRKNPSETDPVILQWMGDIHLHSDLSHEMSGTSDIKYVYIFTVLAAFVLIIACINFMNLTTARSGNRAKEVGMRKVAGA
ncbi:MAG: ABC transporter permease, partial [bacterium]|nr:ABC transporter permease [bacterium]